MNSTAPLPESLVKAIFGRLSGVYGTRFTNQYLTGIPSETGGDRGLENAAAIWAEELGGFDRDAVIFALQNLNAKHPPSALEFRDLCRAAPRKHAAELPYRPTAEEIERARAAANKAAASVSAPRDYLGWVKRPASALAWATIRKLGTEDRAVAEIIEQLREQGIIEGDRLVKRWTGVEWVKA